MSLKTNATGGARPPRVSAADLEIKPFDAADYLTSPARIAGFLEEAIATGDPAVIQHALGAIARARGMSKVAKASGLSRENLYRSLSADYVANFGTIVRVAEALGYELQFKPKKSAHPALRTARRVGAIASGRPRKVAKSSRAG